MLAQTSRTKILLKLLLLDLQLFVWGGLLRNPGTPDKYEDSMCYAASGLHMVLANHKYIYIYLYVTVCIYIFIYTSRLAEFEYN